MTQLQSIKAEIERLKKHYEEGVIEFGREGYKDNALIEQGKMHTCEKLLSFIESLEKEQESLHIPETCKENANSFTDELKLGSKKVYCVDDFKAGAKWMAEQLNEKEK